jgi:hypothetical protein
VLREQHGIRSTIPPEYGRPPKDPDALPPDKYRRMMKLRFRNGKRPRAAYRKRPQVETVFSMLKRNLGAALRARTYHGQRRDLLLRVLTHNIMLALLRVFYRATLMPFSFALDGPTKNSWLLTWVNSQNCTCGAKMFGRTTPGVSRIFRGVESRSSSTQMNERFPEGSKSMVVKNSRSPTARTSKMRVSSSK